MAQTIKTRRRGQGASALAFMNRGFNSGASEVYKDTGERVLGRCEAHKGLHVTRDGCEDFELASTKEVADDTWARLERSLIGLRTTMKQRTTSRIKRAS